jgi:glycosyltransferase involved in cell wall biosynthesis
MHILFVHQNFPAQFGHIASYLIKQKGYRCTFVTEKLGGVVSGIECVQYKVQGGARATNHYCTRTFENAIWHTHAVYEALKARPDICPDLIVGHSGFGSTLFLRELYPDCPIVNYFEYFYRPSGSDMDFRPDFPSTELNRLRARARNAMLLLDLENCDVGYSPTRWQRDRLPSLFHDKVRVVFDGVDTAVWKPAERPQGPRHLGNLTIPAGYKLVTYATRGMESMRGFDIFMKAAKKICDRRKDVVFVIAGQDRVCYGGDEAVTGRKSFKEWVLSQDRYDLSRFHFVGLLPPPVLAQLFTLTDLHFYLTVPFVLSWSLMDALACGTTVLASDTEPVREMIAHGKNGLLVNFFDVDGMADLACRVLDAPLEYRALGEAGAALVRERYSLDVCLPQMLALYEEAQALGRGGKSAPGPLAGPAAAT